MRTIAYPVDSKSIQGRVVCVMCGMKSKFDMIIRGRINWVLLFFLIAFGVLLTRLFVMQIINHREYVDLASKQHHLLKEIFSERGDIFMQDKSGNTIPIALNQLQRNLAASPKDIKNPEDVAHVLTEKLGLPREEIITKLSQKNDVYEILAKKVDPTIATSIESQKISGLFFEEEKRRVYPQGSIGSQLLGFVSKEQDTEVGRYGIESFYEKELSGKKGWFEGVKDASGSWIALGKRITHPPQNGSKIFLTVDYNIQAKAENVLEEAHRKWQATSGNILVIEPKTGRVLAMSAVPTFNPNEFTKEKNYSVFINPAVESMYELGSVMKPITMAGGLQEKIVTPDTTYKDPGNISYGAFTISNFDGKSHGRETMTQVLEKSLNTGAVFVANLLGHARQADYLKKFGFGAKTGIDLPDEVPGNLSNLSSGHDIDFATAAFGQGIVVTPLQLAMAVGAIANGGILMKPYVVEKIVDDSGNEVKTSPVSVREVLSKDTADTLTKMLVSVVQNGYDNRAGVKGYFIAGKTGTAQIPKKDGRGYSGEVIHTFIGYAPAFNPRFLALIQLNEPKAAFAANTLPPFFKNLAEFILHYYEVPPDEK